MASLVRTVADVSRLEMLRPLGKLEQVSAACHHLGFFNNVGLSAHYKLSGPSSSDLCSRIYAAVKAVVRKYRILFAIPVNEGSPDAYFACLPSIDLSRSITFRRRSRPPAAAVAAAGAGCVVEVDEELDAILEDQHNTNFKAGYGSLPFWRLIILQTPGLESEFTASFIYHHAIGDGVSGLAFHRAFREALELETASVAFISSSVSPPSPTEEVVFPDKSISVLPDLWELHPMPISTRPPATAPATGLMEWTGSSVSTPCKSRWSSFCLPPTASRAFFQECKENSVSVTSALSSVTAMVLFSILPPGVDALTCIIPVNLRPWLRLPQEAASDAIGTYFDATKAHFTRRDQGSDIWPGAHIAAKAVSDYLQNTSPSGEPYTAVAVFQAIPDVSVIFQSTVGKPRDAAFELTNVGLFASPEAPNSEAAGLWEVGKVMLSRSSVASGAAVTVSAATGGNGSLAVGFSWQGGVLEDNVIASVIQGVKKYFETY